MASGVKVRDECVQAFHDMKMSRLYRYVIFSMTDDLREVRVLKTGARDASYDEFLDEMVMAMQQRQCRYAIYDVPFDLGTGEDVGLHLREKIALILWSPDCATVKQKMLYTSSKNELKKKLVGSYKDVQATDVDELAWEVVVNKCAEREAY